jgi:glycosyltransferase involved in cell wall biosynthesis
VSLEHARASRTLHRALAKRPEVLVELPNGVDTELFRPDIDGAPMRRALGLPDDAAVVAFVGVLDDAHNFKRLDLLINALHALECRDVHLLVVGDGDQRPAYQAQAAQLGLADRCHFVGRVAHQQLPPYLAAADLLVLPSDSVESFGLVLIEALACGKPVIASDLPGVSTIVRDQTDGLRVPPGNADALAEAMRALLSDPAQCVAMGRAGRERVVARYGWDVVADRIEEIYRDVLGARRGAVRQRPHVAR